MLTRLLFVLHLLAVNQRVRSESLRLLAGSLLLLAAGLLKLVLMLDLFSLVVVLLSRLDPLALLISMKIRNEGVLLTSCKVGRDFGWVTDYHVVDVVIVDNVRDVTSCLLHLSIGFLCVSDG